MGETKLVIPILQPGERVVGSAYLTQEGEIVFSPNRGDAPVVLVEPQAGSSGPWAVRVRPVRPLTPTAGS